MAAPLAIASPSPVAVAAIKDGASSASMPASSAAAAPFTRLAAYVDSLCESILSTRQATAHWRQRQGQRGSRIRIRSRIPAAPPSAADPIDLTLDDSSPVDDQRLRELIDFETAIQQSMRDLQQSAQSVKEEKNDDAHEHAAAGSSAAASSSFSSAAAASSVGAVAPLAAVLHHPSLRAHRRRLSDLSETCWTA